MPKDEGEGDVVCEDEDKGLKGNNKGDSNNDNDIVTQGQQHCHHCCCHIVGHPRMRVRAMVRVHKDKGLKGDNEGDGDSEGV